MKNLFGYSILFLATVVGCSPVTTGSMTGIEAYSEDLSVHRPKIENALDIQSDTSSAIIEEVTYPQPEFDVTENLKVVLDSIDRIKATRTFVDGFTIQVYSGINSEEAKIARGKVYTILEDSSPSLKYEEPNFKVKVGTFYSRLEAQKTYSEIKTHFPKSIVIPKRIYLKDIDR